MVEKMREQRIVPLILACFILNSFGFQFPRLGHTNDSTTDLSYVDNSTYGGRQYFAEPPPIIIENIEPFDLLPSNILGEARVFAVTLTKPCTVYWVVNEAYPGSPADALVNEYHRRIEGEVDVTPIPHRLGNLINERVIRRDVNVSFSKLEIPAAVVGTFWIMAVVQYDEAGYVISEWTWEIKAPIKAPTRWPLIAGIVVTIAIIGIVAAFYMRRR
jgi:hypothetical protein